MWIKLRHAGVIALAMQMAQSVTAQAPTPAELQALAQESAAQQKRYDAMLDTPGSGPFAAEKRIDPAFPGYVTYRPSDLTALHRPLKVLIWGNGGCSADGASARLHLAEIASHGYLVLAPGSIRSGPGVPPRARPVVNRAKLTAETKPVALARALDLVERAAKTGHYNGWIDTSRIAVGGHSCGGLQALAVAPDPRVRTAVIQNSGLFPDGNPGIDGIVIPKSQLERLHSPVLYVLGGPRDIAYPNGMDDYRRITKVPVAVTNLPVGHGGTFAEPNGGAVAQVVVDWLAWRLDGDAAAGRRFAGKECGLCRDPRWTYEAKGL
jgi:dienelactone hydrolase